MESRRRRRLVMGSVLVVLGGWFYLMELGYLQQFGAELILTVLGSLFFLAYWSFDNYGFLVPSGILLGLAAGIALEESLQPVGDGPLMGLACGFLLIFLIPRFRGSSQGQSWWPLIPALILFILAVPGLRDLFDLVADHWQLILVLVGLVLIALALLGGSGGGRSRQRERPAPPSNPPAPPDNGWAPPVSPPP